MTATNKPMTGAQLDELMAVAMRMQSDSEKMGERPVSIFAYAVQIAVLEIREVRRKYEELQSQNADLAVQLANAESKCRELAAENAGLKNFIINDCHVAHIEPETFYKEEITRYVSADGYEPETPATDAFLAEVWAQGVEGFLKFCGEENSVFVETKAYYRSLSDAVDEFSAQLRQGVQS
ncbi:hypothetical protein [Citrobacter youngae]|uniref:hypothetical protein n=1 Tax=Citrobacter youngae TaxID=133448 RepID=UPI00397992D9